MRSNTNSSQDIKLASANKDVSILDVRMARQLWNNKLLSHSLSTGPTYNLEILSHIDEYSYENFCLLFT